MSYVYQSPQLAQTSTPPLPRVRPDWAEDLKTFYLGRIARQFVLHFNITDFVIDLSERKHLDKGEYIRTGAAVAVPEPPLTMREYLHQFLFEETFLKFQAIYTYSLANGLVADEGQNRGAGSPLGRELRGPAMQRLYEAAAELRLIPQRQSGQQKEGQEIKLPDNVNENFKLLGHLLRQKHFADRGDVGTTAKDTPEAPVAIILDYVEKLIPYHLGEGQGDREQLQALEMVQRWALDPLIRQTGNIIILLTTNIGQIPSSVYAEGSGCRSIRVPLPNIHEREAFIRYEMTRRQGKLVTLHPGDFGSTEEKQADHLARVTQGMRLTDIDNLSRRVKAEFIIKRRLYKLETAADIEAMRADDVQRAKAEAIQAQSEQLLEIVPPVRSFNEIGGLDSLKKYLEKRTGLMLDKKNSPLVPTGLLLAGPPGTGKTIIAEALATESQFNLVKMRNIQDKWVGSSERNLEMVLSLLKDLHPVVVFVDEIDQAMVRRDTGQSGDSGVGARMFARILEEMSNPANRGGILWVAATNRADILDDALLRRFDRVVPLLVPDANESCRIFATMVDMIVKQSAGSIKVSYGGDLEQSGNKKGKRPDPTNEDLEKFRKVAEVTAELGLTGAGIEIVVRRAIEIAYEEMLDAQPSADTHAPPLIESRHLLTAIRDFKPNHNRTMYDYQSLLAIRACNFYSVIPLLPQSGVYGRIQSANGRIDTDKLEAAISELRSILARQKG